MVSYGDWCPMGCGKSVVYQKGGTKVKTPTNHATVMKNIYYCSICKSVFILTNWHKKLPKRDRIYEKKQGVRLYEQRHY